MIRIEGAAVSPRDFDHYTSGACHVFAIALHRTFGWEMVAMTDFSEPYAYDAAGDIEMPSVWHVYCRDGNGDLHDVTGVRAGQDWPVHFREVFPHCDVDQVSLDVCETEADLSHYMDVGADDEDRPLGPAGERDIQEALALVGTLYARQLAPAC